MHRLKKKVDANLALNNICNYKNNGRILGGGYPPSSHTVWKTLNNESAACCMHFFHFAFDFSLTGVSYCKNIRVMLHREGCMLDTPVAELHLHMALKLVFIELA